MSNNEKAPEPTFFQVAKAVMSAFIGIRKKSDLENDAANLKPAHVIIGAMIFVVSILLLVKIVVQ